jgi:hypothetical protein
MNVVRHDHKRIQHHATEMSRDLVPGLPDDCGDSWSLKDLQLGWAQAVTK